MQRRRFLQLAAGSTLLAGCKRIQHMSIPVTLHLPGQREGHWLRDLKSLPASSGELRTGTVILGSGVAGLTAAWKLAREGYRDFVLLAGPEPYGNAAAGEMAGLRYPRGAHYLPLPSLESVHVREMLADFGVIESGAATARPHFDERVLVHAPESRVLYQGRWQEGTLPSKGIPADEAAQQQRFFRHIDALKVARGADGRRVFCIPLAQSSQDPRWTALDRLSFAAWLTREGYSAPTLRWYLDYACRDDYGAGLGQVSAWAGLHYFASRAGQAANADDGAVLTWPDGLNPLTRRLQQAATGATGGRWQPGFALQLSDGGHGVDILCAESAAADARVFTVRAERAICAMPLQLAQRVVPALGVPGDAAVPHVPWLVSNFLLRGFPPELAGEALSWDNVVYGSQSLGYVVSTHQLIRQARPEQTVFSAYHALAHDTPANIRRWLMQAGTDELYELANSDLRAAYGHHLWLNTQSVEITVRGHAMVSPAPGFLSRPGIAALRGADQRLLFAHSDLSGISVFEEAAWWGWRAALAVLGGVG
ncbi:NAD(P)-binding protein [Chitinivorax sp. PXF-14]|uniref:NAD(P)-binding protein n=1 Tax=Chitinivorax sp. PXF-14 TaxID=3230488 RepID=UPI0034670CA8